MTRTDAETLRECTNLAVAQRDEISALRAENKRLRSGIESILRTGLPVDRTDAEAMVNRLRALVSHKSR